MCNSQENEISGISAMVSMVSILISPPKEVGHEDIINVSPQSSEMEMGSCVDMMAYTPVCIEWQTSKCNSLGLDFYQANNIA